MAAVSERGERLHGKYSMNSEMPVAHELDVIRYYQAAQMFEKHLMLPVRVLHDELSPSFDRQLLAT